MDDAAFQTFRTQLREHLEILQAKLAATDALVAPSDRQSIQTSIADFRLYLALTENQSDRAGPDERAEGSGRR
jgi:hypothetical protein